MPSTWPGDDVAAQAVVGAQGFFEVDGAGFGQAGGFGQRFGGDVDGEAVEGKVQRRGRHAGAVERDAVAQAHVIKVTRRRLDGEALAVV
jgi:hypothetical protein